MLARSALAYSLLLSVPAQAQDTGAAQVVPMERLETTLATRTIVLKRDTPVHLMVLSEVTTKSHAVGHRFKLRVNRPIIVDGLTVVPVGTFAYGEVTSAESSGNVGKSGKVSARLLNIDLRGQAIPISGETSSAGNSGTGETIMGVLAMGPLGLFAKGNNAKIKGGELMNGFTVSDLSFEIAPDGSARLMAATRVAGPAAPSP